MKYFEFPLNQKYLRKIEELKLIKLAIVGKDPYPSGARSIPFVKSCWEQLDGRSAGRYLFRSLLCEKTINEKEKGFENPENAAFTLLTYGIVLLNASYNFLEKEPVSESKHGKFVENALRINCPIFKKSKKICICGKDTEKMLNWVLDDGDIEFDLWPHPALQSRNRTKEENVKMLWDSIWGDGKLKRQIGLNNL